MTYKHTIALDFDGVIHAYTSPWTHVYDIHDPPVEGAFDFIRAAIREGFFVTIYTARANEPDGMFSEHLPERVRERIRDWLVKHGLEDEVVKLIPITATKPSAIIYIDDRGWRFEGTFPSFETIRSLKQWNKGVS